MIAGYMARYNKSPARQAVEEYMKIAKKYGVTPSQLALAWCNQRWTVTSTIIGATSMDQLKVSQRDTYSYERWAMCVGFDGRDCVQENIDAFNIELPDEAINEINLVHAAARDPSNQPLEG